MSLFVFISFISLALTFDFKLPLCFLLHVFLSLIGLSEFSLFHFGSDLSGCHVRVPTVSQCEIIPEFSFFYLFISLKLVFKSVKLAIVVMKWSL